MKWALIVVLLLIFGLILGPNWAGHTGYILIAVGPWTIETSVVAAIVAVLLTVIVLSFLIKLVARVVRRSKLGIRWFGKRRENKAEEAYLHGLKLMLHGDYQHGLQSFSRAWGYRKRPETAMLAAYSAQQAGMPSQAKPWLEKAELSDADVALAALLLALEVTDQGSQAALPEIRNAVKAYPQHPKVLRIAAEVFEQHHAWEDLRTLLPTLKNSERYTEQELYRLEMQTYLEVFKAKGRLNGDDLKAYWKGLDRSLRRTAAVRIAYIRALIALGLNEAAGKVLSRSLQRNEVAVAEALEFDLLRPGAEALFQFLQDRLKQTPNDGLLLHALGRLALRSNDHSLAQRALRKAAEQAPSTMVYLDLASAYQHLGDTQLALDSYGKAHARDHL